MQRLFNKQFIKFGIAGVVNTAVDWSIYFMATYLLSKGNFPVAGKIAGSIGGITSAFFSNSLWVFRKDFIPAFCECTGIRKKSLFVIGSYCKMLLTYALGLTINISVFYSLRHFHFYDLVCLAAATFCSLFFNFYYSKKYVFKYAS